MKWYYADNMSAEDILVDEFADSKFGIDRWNSFSREIIQNSIDAVDDESKPVEVVFDLNKELSLENIPEGYYIKSQKIKIYPTKDQAEFIDRCINTSRFIHNWALNFIYNWHINYIIDADDDHLKEYPSKYDMLSSKTTGLVPASTIVSAAQAAFCAIAESFSTSS